MRNTWLSRNTVWMCALRASAVARSVPKGFSTTIRRLARSWAAMPWAPSAETTGP